MTSSIRVRPTPWKSVILLCGKCARKMDGGYGPGKKETLRTALRSELKASGHGRSVRIIETRCLGICPKKAVTAVNASSPNHLLTIPRGAPMAEALAQILGEADEATSA